MKPRNEPDDELMEDRRHFERALPPHPPRRQAAFLRRLKEDPRLADRLPPRRERLRVLLPVKAWDAFTRVASGLHYAAHSGTARTPDIVREAYHLALPCGSHEAASSPEVQRYMTEGWQLAVSVVPGGLLSSVRIGDHEMNLQDDSLFLLQLDPSNPTALVLEPISLQWSDGRKTVVEIGAPEARL